MKKQLHLILIWKTVLCFMIFLSSWTLSLAQINVSGAVFDEAGETMPGVNVLIKGTTSGTVTDMDGKYSLEVPTASTVLVFSFVGFVAQEIVVGDRRTIDITLVEDTKELEEVVVVGYGTAKLKDLTAPIAVVKQDVFEKQATSNPMQALQGKVAGVQIINNGAPGSGSAVRIRGVGSIGDYAKPLYVVDGVFVDNIDFLNNNDIQSMSVLKDASASAIYGVRAANGVILVTTKSGAGGKPVVTYDGYVALQVPVNIMKMTNTAQYVTLRNESNYDWISKSYKIGYTPVTVDQYNGADTDWYDVLLHNALMTNHSLDVSGSTDKTNYSVGANYLYQDGILDVSNNYKRLNIRAKGEFQLSKMARVGFSALVSKYDHVKPNDDAFFRAFMSPPIYHVYDDNNTAAYPVKFGSPQSVGLGNEYSNPYAAAYYYDALENGYHIIPSVFLELNFFEDRLTFKTQYSQDLTFIRERTYSPEYFVGGSQGLTISTLTKKSNEFTKSILDNTLTFRDVIRQKHNYSLMVGNSVRQETNPWLEGSALNVPGTTDEMKYIKNGSYKSRNANDDGRKDRGMSYFFRGTYGYDNRYLATFTFRADGSSKYQEKWGYFPSVGLGWIISSENFMQRQQVFNYLKMRASWGQLGNDNVPTNSTYILGEAGAASSGIFGDQLVDGVGAQTVFQNYLKWEVVTEFDVGFDFAMASQRLNGSLDFFRRQTDNVVFVAPVASGGGTAELLGNNGSVRNMGIELALSWDDKISENLSYSIGINLTTVYNKVVKVLNTTTGKVPGATINGTIATYSVVGKPIGAFYGYKVDGVYLSEREALQDPTAPAWASPGYFKYQDVNGDGKIDANDMTYLGSPTPKLMGGLDFGLVYKNFDFSLSLQGQWGNKILNQKRMNRGVFTTANYDEAFYNNRWTADNPSSDYPSAEAYGNGNIQQPNSFYVENGWYIRLQNVQVGYTIPFNNPAFPTIRCYVSAQRPYTLFKYNGFTPEISGEPNKTGIDNTVYPMQAIYSVGIRAIF